MAIDGDGGGETYACVVETACLSMVSLLSSILGDDGVHFPGDCGILVGSDGEEYP